jgi:hypothetical protein
MTKATSRPVARRNGYMSTPPDGSKHPLDAAEIERWVHTATNKRLELLVRAAEPLYLARAEAFTEMTELLKDVIEELRVVSAALREESTERRGRAGDLKARSTRLMERSRRTQAS